MSRFEDIEERAAQWLAKEDDGLDTTGREALSTWLDESDLHRVIYLRLQHAWRQADRLSALKGPSLPAAAPRHIWWRMPDVRAAAVAVLLVAICGGLIYHYSSSGGYVTAIGEQEKVRLADGTQIQLNTNTRLHARITAKRRIVVLERGEAYFDVFHDPKRPFTVIAGDRQIVDIGTKFSVRRDGDQVKVLVSEGQVRVDVPSEKRRNASVLVNANGAVIAKAGETLVMKKARAAVDEDLAWRSGVLVFNQQTLAEAAAQFNRYSTKQIVVKGDARNLRIGGSFRINNVDAFAQLIREGFGLDVTENEDTIVISN